MRKQRIFSKRNIKTVIALALAAALTIPTASNLVPVIADETAVESVVPKRLLDFNEGLKEYNSSEDVKLEIVTTESQYVHLTEEEKGPTDRLEANGILIMGNGSGAYFKSYIVSNQPSTYVDSTRGTVLYMGKTVTVEAVTKTQSSVVKSESGDEDKDATAQLDSLCPIPEGEDKTIQPEMVVRSELNFKNPIADSAEKFSVSMWIKIPTAEGVENELAGDWHHVAVTADGDSTAYYLDGAAKEDANVVDSIKSWVASGERLSIGGTTDSAKAFAAAFGITDANAAIMLDDIAFYTDVLTADDVAAQIADANKEIEPVANRIRFNDIQDISKAPTEDGYPGVSGTVTTEISSTTDTVNGKAGQEVISIPENKKASTSTGAFIKNPFAGKSLEGATISFWTKQEPRSGKGSDGTEVTPIMSMLDTTKSINHIKSNSKGDAWSMIGVSSDGTAIFKEAFSDDGVGNSLKNSYGYSISPEDKENYKVTDWYQVTLVMNNAGIKMYINGVLYENNTKDSQGKSTAAGARFLDGYFVRAEDEKDPKTKFNIYGGSNNQYATTLMSYLNYDDIKLFLGYKPSTSTLNVKSNPTFFSGIRTFDMDLTEEQVKALYQDSTIYDAEEEPTPPVTEGVLGDADLSGTVDLSDATLVLKAALNIEKLEGQGAINADVNKNGEIDLDDATSVLKAALNIEQLK